MAGKAGVVREAGRGVKCGLPLLQLNHCSDLTANRKNLAKMLPCSFAHQFPEMLYFFFSKGKSLLLNLSYFIKRKNNLTLLVIGCNRLPSMWFLWESHPALVSQAGVLTATLWNHALVLNFSYLLELLV